MTNDDILEFKQLLLRQIELGKKYRAKRAEGAYVSCANSGNVKRNGHTATDQKSPCQIKTVISVKEQIRSWVACQACKIAKRLAS